MKIQRRRRNRKTFALILSTVLTAVLLLSPCAGYAEDISSYSNLGQMVTFQATSSSRRTGTSDSETTGTSNDNTMSSESETTKQNRESAESMYGYFAGLGGNSLTDIFQYLDGETGRRIFFENMDVPIGDLLNQVKNHTFHPGDANYNMTNTAGIQDDFIPLGREDQAIFESLANGTADTTSALDTVMDAVRLSWQNIYSTAMRDIVGWWNLADIMQTGQWDLQGNMPPWVEEYLRHMNNVGGYPVPAGTHTLFDMPTNTGRYEMIRKGLEELLRQLGYTDLSAIQNGVGNYTSISDTVTVQHIVEYCAVQVNDSVLYAQVPIQFTDYGGGYYRWSVEFTDVEDPNYQGRMQTMDSLNLHPLSKTDSLHIRFNTAGRYTIRAKQRLQNQFVKSLSFNLYEYWVLKDTGQILYSHVVNNGGIGDKATALGRSYDVNTAYYHAELSMADTNRSEPDGIPGTIVREIYHLVRPEDLNGVFPSPGIISNGTLRIE